MGEAGRAEARKVYKVLPRSEWEAARAAGAYGGSADDLADGFVHLSAADQLPGTLARHFAGRAGLVLVAFEAAALGGALRWEASRGGDLFPHLHAPLPAGAALWAEDLPLGEDGTHRLPARLGAPA